ncbi:MAG: hemerythrin, partial [Candidatus Kapaibacteriota bacterium]
MAFIEWNDNYSVGVSIIDNQHKQLIRIINELHEGMGTGKGKDVLGKV